MFCPLLTLAAKNVETILIKNCLKKYLYFVKSTAGLITKIIEHPTEE